MLSTQLSIQHQWIIISLSLLVSHLTARDANTNEFAFSKTRHICIGPGKPDARLRFDAISEPALQRARVPFP